MEIDHLLKEFDFSTLIQIRFSDIDGYMHVNNGVYFNYFEHSSEVLTEIFFLTTLRHALIE